MARHVLSARRSEARTVSVSPPGHDDCADSTRTVASVAGRGGLSDLPEPGGSVAIEGAAAFNPAAFQVGRLRAAGGLIKPTPVEFPEDRLNMELGSSAEWVMV